MNRKGFTLVELIIVIAIIAILAGIIFVAVDPARRFNEARNSRRASDVATILDAIKQYQADNNGVHYSKIADLATNSWYQIGTQAADCSLVCSGLPSNAICVDLTDIGANYMAVVPKDPDDGTDEQTKYGIYKGAEGSITIEACHSEGEGPGGTGEAPTIKVTR